MTADLLRVHPRIAQLGVAHRLAVAWQHPVSRSIQPVGLLTCDTEGFRFDYLRSAAHVEGFQPFLGFPQVDRQYQSAELFPLFAQRVMRPTRPDYRDYLRALALNNDATAWAILARSHGEREGDGIRVFAEPDVDEAGRTSATFFASGLSHRIDRIPAVRPALDQLSVGDRLTLCDEPDNAVDSRALLITERGSVALAWIPSVLLSYVHTVRRSAEPVLTVAAVNGSDVPPAFRLLVALSGIVPPEYRPFGGPEWALAGADPAS